MEDTLGDISVPKWNIEALVLILVLMEDTLGDGALTVVNAILGAS